MNVVSFTKVSLPYGWLGNMAAYPVECFGHRWKTTEALFQAMRFDDDAIKEKIRNESGPMGAKFVAKGHADRMVIEPMSSADLFNMDLCLRLKVRYHPELVQMLLDTGGSAIIEDVTNRTRPGRHTFWGARQLADGSWEGDNVLGRLWCRIRNDLKAMELPAYYG